MIAFEKPSKRQRLFKGILKLLPSVFPKDQAKFDKMLSTRKADAPPIPKKIVAACRVESREDDGQRIVTLTPKGGTGDWHILYLHGGGYVLPASPFHWAMIGRLIEVTGAAVTVPLYALSPENDHRRGTAMVRRAYDRLRAEHGGRVAVAGDSAGANFALSLAQRLRADGAAMPDHLVLFSPWLDFTGRDPAMAAVEPHDIMLTVDGLRHAGTMWAGDVDPADPLMSPLYADLNGLPPMTIFQGTHDIFVIDARTFTARAEAADVDIDYFEYEGAVHDFMIFNFLPEAKDCHARVASVLGS
ncbi:MAG: alpha/beta hydrolase [Pacificimonas sp.]|jgi:acetyl esterase/lipase|nr:alpha/beta hydrolase [Pacificimonas sp.]